MSKKFRDLKPGDLLWRYSGNSWDKPEKWSVGETQKYWGPHGRYQMSIAAVAWGNDITHTLILPKVGLEFYKEEPSGSTWFASEKCLKSTMIEYLDSGDHERAWNIWDVIGGPLI